MGEVPLRVPGDGFPQSLKTGPRARLRWPWRSRLAAWRWPVWIRATGPTCGQPWRAPARAGQVLLGQVRVSRKGRCRARACDAHARQLGKRNGRRQPPRAVRSSPGGSPGREPAAPGPAVPGPRPSGAGNFSREGRGTPPTGARLRDQGRFARIRPKNGRGPREAGSPCPEPHRRLAEANWPLVTERGTVPVP